MDEWYGMTIEDVREMEENTKQALQKVIFKIIPQLELHLTDYYIYSYLLLFSHTKEICPGVYGRHRTNYCLLIL